MQQTNEEIKKLQKQIISSFTEKSSVVATVAKQTLQAKNVKDGLDKTTIQLKTESIFLKRIEKTFREIDQNIRLMGIFSLGVLTLANDDLTSELKRAGKRRGRRTESTFERVPEKQRTPRLRFPFLFRRKPKPRLRVKPRVRPRPRIKPSIRKRNFNRRLRVLYNRLRARARARIARLRGVERYRANVRAERIRRRQERARFRQERNRLAQSRRLLDDQSRTTRALARQVLQQAEADAGRIRTSAQADAQRIRTTSQVEAQRITSAAQTDAQQTRLRAQQVQIDADQARVNAVAEAERVQTEARTRATQITQEANQNIEQANRQLARIQEDVKRAAADAVDARQFADNARRDLQNIRQQTDLTVEEQNRRIADYERRIREFESIRQTMRDDITRLVQQRLNLQNNVRESEARIVAAQQAADEAAQQTQRRALQRYTSGEVAPTPSVDTPLRPARVEPPPAVAPTTARATAAIFEQPVAEPVKPQPIDRTRRGRQIAALLRAPPRVQAPLNILTPAQKTLLNNRAQVLISQGAQKAVAGAALVFSKYGRVIQITLGVGFALKAAVDRNKVGVAINLYAAFATSFTGLFIVIYIEIVNDAYKDVYGVYPIDDPDPNWFVKLTEIHILLYEQVKEAWDKIKKSGEEIKSGWQRDWERIQRVGVLPFLGEAFDTSAPGARARRQQQREQQQISRPSITTPVTSVGQAILSAAQRTGVDPKILYAIAQAESSLGTNLYNPESSATGLFQFTLGTWGDMKRWYPEYKSILDRGPTDLEANALAGALYIQRNAKHLEKAGIPVNLETIYAAHFLGAGRKFGDGAIGLFERLQTDPDKRADQFFPNAARSNPDIFYYKVRGQQAPRTVKEVVDFLRNRINRSAEASAPIMNRDMAANQILRTSESNNSQTDVGKSQNVVIINNNTNVLGSANRQPTYGAQQATTAG